MTIKSANMYALFSRATSFMRPLPDFLVIGAQKSGTTSFFHYIAQHPQIFDHKAKELHFFDIHYAKGTGWYKSQFPLLASFKKDSLVGEATPYYLCHPHAPERMHKLIPGVKLIMLLRNPVDRAVSHYFHEVKKGREILPIDEAMTAEDSRCDVEWEKMRHDPFYISRVHQSFSYKQRGIYIEQLQRYLRFFDRDQIHIVDSNRLFSSPQDVLEDTFLFLGIQIDVVIEDVSVKNANPKNAEVPEEVYDRLSAFFAPHNERLKLMLDIDFGW